MGNREGQSNCHVISEVFTYPFVVAGEQECNDAQALLVHLTLYNSIQAFKELGATLEEDTKGDSEQRHLFAEGGPRHDDLEELDEQHRVVMRG